MKQSNLIHLTNVRQFESRPDFTESLKHFTVQNLNVEIDRKVILSDISMDIYKGQITAIIGPSGCGKSTFLANLNQLIRTISAANTSGLINFNGENITQTDVDLISLRRKVGMIFQQPNPFPLSIRKNLDLPLREHSVKHRQQREQKIQIALEEVGLWDEVKDRLDTDALALSGGQQQRLCIARAIVLEPEVILMDEPCSALDPISSAVVEDLILKLKKRFTVVVVTHNLAQAKRISDFVAFFWLQNNAGSLVEFGASEQVFQRPCSELTRAYITGARG